MASWEMQEEDEVVRDPYAPTEEQAPEGYIAHHDSAFNCGHGTCAFDSVKMAEACLKAACTSTKRIDGISRFFVKKAPQYPTESIVWPFGSCGEPL